MSHAQSSMSLEKATHMLGRVWLAYKGHEHGLFHAHAREEGHAHALKGIASLHGHEHGLIHAHAREEGHAHVRVSIARARIQLAKVPPGPLYVASNLASPHFLARVPLFATLCLGGASVTKQSKRFYKRKTCFG